jgi:hypothetical protein
LDFRSRKRRVRDDQEFCWWPGQSAIS